MYSLEYVPSKYFKIFIRYIVGLKGMQWDWLAKAAREFVEAPEKITELFDNVESRIDDVDAIEKMKSLKLKRVEWVLEKLSAK